jgi:cholesterol oxidase
MDFDAIVVGSGFGGAVVGARLAEKSYRVLILERGREWRVEDYPRGPGDAWIWDQAHPERRNGWFDFRIFPNMSIVQGAGVGGGSLVYANVSIDAKEDSFRKGWPPEIDRKTLEPHYKTVGAMLGVRKVPANQLPERTRLVRDAANRSGLGAKFRLVDLAVSFDEQWHYGLTDPHNHDKSKTFVNAQQQEQGTCVHLGECDIGCKVKARNTLDLTYLPLAKRHGAQVRPLHLVRNVALEGRGYRVHFDRIQNGALVPGSHTARIVILAAGSLGSTELLLRCRDIHKTLPKVSARLGKGWSSNGDFLTPAIHPFRAVNPTRGPTITSAIDLLDGTVNGQEIFIEDGGFPDLVRGFMQRAATRPGKTEQELALLESIRLLTSVDAFQSVMPWFAQGRDAADGTLSLRNTALFLEWEIKESERTIDAIVETHQRLARHTQGAAFVPWTWTSSRDLITPHPLGGANMGTSAATGVVDHKGEVFGYRNLYVADGAIVPEAIGLNPSKTIAALAERIASLIAAEGR